MTLIVKNVFRDKTDHVTVYEPGTILEVKDKERAADLVKRGLCTEYKGKKPAAVTLGEDTPAEVPEAGADKNPAAPAESGEAKTDEQ